MNTVKLNLAGFTTVRRSPKVVDAVNQTAQALARKATGMAVIPHARYSAAPARPSEYGTIALVSGRDPSGALTPSSGAAAADEATHATLERALGSGS